MSHSINRRDFMKKSIAVAGIASTFAINQSAADGNILGANDRVRVAVAGINGRGQNHITEYAKMNNVEVACLVDPDSVVLERIQKQIQENHGNSPVTFTDLRDSLNEDHFDALSVASCNHTHSLLSIWGIQAGKDVYVEKPCSHNVFEGRQLVHAAKKYKAIVQHGTQSRCSKITACLTYAAKSGKYGKLRVAKGYCCKPRWTIGFKPTQDPPQTLNWDAWLGPAPMQPYHANLVHYNWHWFWDMGNGDIGNQGIHELDIARWGVGQSLPKSIISFGARYVNEPEHGFKDQGETPNMILTLYDFDDVIMLFETRGLVENKTNWKLQVDNEFYTDQGKLQDQFFFPYDSDEKIPLEVDYPVPHNEDPFTNFIDCVRSRKNENLDAPISEGHDSAALAHLGNISWRLGEPDSQDAIRRAFGNNEFTQKAIDAVFQNMSDALPDLKDPQYQLGPKLTFDPKAEKFVGNEQANALLTREYREPFVVPDLG